MTTKRCGACDRYSMGFACSSGKVLYDGVVNGFEMSMCGGWAKSMYAIRRNGIEARLLRQTMMMGKTMEEARAQWVAKHG